MFASYSHTLPNAFKTHPPPTHTQPFTWPYSNITAIDLSPIIVNAMQQYHRRDEGLTFTVADARNMEGFPSNQFDLIYDKGCFDAIFCSLNYVDDARRYAKVRDLCACV